MANKRMIGVPVNEELYAKLKEAAMGRGINSVATYMRFLAVESLKTVVDEEV